MDNHYYVSCSDMHRDFSSFHYRNTYVHKHDPFVTNMMRIFWAIPLFLPPSHIFIFEDTLSGRAERRTSGSEKELGGKPDRHQVCLFIQTSYGFCSSERSV